MKDFSSLPALAERVVRQLEDRGMSVALAESCTGGLVAKTLTDVSGTSHVFECGIVAYSEAIKQKVLGVKAETLAAHSVVSPQVAFEMARGVRALSGADFGIGITGVAGPGPDGDHPEGEIYIALVSEKTDNIVMLEDRSENERTKHRVQAAETALTMLDAQLSNTP